eukprot:g15580.t1
MAQIAGEHAAQAALEKKAQTYFEERPKIDEGLKTLLSIKLAVQTSSPVKGGAGNTFANDGVLEIIRCLSLSINSLELLKPMAWAAKFPQKAGAVERMEEIADYKALYALHSSLSKRVEEKKKKVKATKAFGISFLKTKGILHAVIEKTKLLVADRIKSKKDLQLASEDVDTLLNDFAKSVYLAKSPEKETATTHDNTETPKQQNAKISQFDDESLLDIIWLTNWRAEIQRRRELRQEKAKNRVIETETMAKEQLKEHLSSVQGDTFHNLEKNDESDSDPQVLQVSSAVRDMLIGEGFAKVNVLNALLDTNGDVDAARQLLSGEREKNGTGNQTP